MNRKEMFIEKISESNVTYLDGKIINSDTINIIIENVEDYYITDIDKKYKLLYLKTHSRKLLSDQGSNFKIY
jgi:hypothetical protein